jgi:hypothetical protein
MTDQINVENYFINEISTEQLIEQAHSLASKRSLCSESIAEIKSKAFDNYQEAISKLLS